MKSKLTETGYIRSMTTSMAPTNEFCFKVFNLTDNGRCGLAKPSLANHLAFLTEFTLSFRCISCGAYFYSDKIHCLRNNFKIISTLRRAEDNHPWDIQSNHSWIKLTYRRFLFDCFSPALLNERHTKLLSDTIHLITQ